MVPRLKAVLVETEVTVEVEVEVKVEVELAVEVEVEMEFGTFCQLNFGVGQMYMQMIDFDKL